MAKKMLIDATHAEETRVVVVDGNKVEEFDFESENKRQLAGNIYLAKVTRVEPSLQAAFVDYGGNRHGFLAFSEIHPDYYQIPVADRQALMEEERAYAEAMRARDDEEESKPSRRKPRSRSKAAKADDGDAVTATDASSHRISGMETIDLDGEEDTPEGSSPMETVKDTPVETPASDESAETSQDADDGGPGAEAETDSGSEKRQPSAASGKSDTGNGDEGYADETSGKDASAKDDSIESVSDEDDSEDIRPARKPRPRRYKIQEVVKVRQILLVQVVKEERGNKGAALTTYLSLAGRYCVLMPNTARGGGISRKITNAVDRKKLKEIANEIEVPTGAGLIVRTAGAKRTKAEIKRDYEYLQRLWEQIRELTLKSIAPAKIYEEGDLIKRSIRDLYNREIDEVFVEGDRGYKIAKDFMRMIMPSHAKNVKRYEDSLPLFARYQVESYLAGMFNPTVQLKSGGYIVIGVTEALVAIDVNSGRATKEGSIEETALKTNLEASDEVARQLRLRDLAGLIVIDFIDMDERKNNAAVEKRLKERLKTDRARIQVGRISGFGLMEMSRQRLRPGMLEASTQPCQACHGTGIIRSDDSMALSILRQIEEEGTRARSREVLVRCPVGIANFLINAKREHVAQIEGRYGMAVRVEGDPSLVSPDFTMEKFKTATRNVALVETPVISADATFMDDLDEEEPEEDIEETTPPPSDTPATSDDDGKPKRRRRRRRRRKSSGGESGQSDAQSESRESDDDSSSDREEDAKPDRSSDEAPEPSQKDPEMATEADANTDTPRDAADAEDKPKKPKRKPRSRKKDSQPAAEQSSEAVQAETADVEAAPAAEPAENVAQDAEPPVAVPEEKQKPARPSRARRPKRDAAPADEETAAAPSEPEPVPADAGNEAENSAPSKPKRRGWWSLGSK